MKKYRQLLLLIISITSLALFLIYRHEYNRLHYVLEVFNFFGEPCNFTDLLQSNQIASHHDWGPAPAWSLDEHVKYYSAFWTANNEALALVALSKKVPGAKTCYLWYEDKEDPIVGKFKYSKFGAGLNYDAYYYYCKNNEGELPYAVSFAKNYRINKQKLLLKTTSNSVVFNITTCVIPDDLTKRALIENLSFHSVIGIDSFIVYADMPYKFIKLVKNLQTKLEFNVEFYSWNYPQIDTSLTRLIIEQDCLMRTINQSKFVTTIHASDYIVPSVDSSLRNVLTAHETSFDRITLAVEKFCIKNSLSNKPIALQNFESIYNDEKLTHTIYKNKKGDNVNVVSSKGIDKSLMSLHKYVNCGENNNKKSYENKALLRFSTDFVRSTLVQLFLHRTI